MTDKKIVVPVDKTHLITNPKWQQEFIQNYWLKLGDTTQIKTTNPFSVRTQYELENPHVFVLELMRRPENFYFTCKHLLNKQLHPFQLAVLRELWSKPFPMFIGSRGAGKCVGPNTYIMTNDRVCRIHELVGDADEMEAVFTPGLQAYGENGFKNVAYAWNNGVSETRTIRTHYGYELTGTLNHPIRVVRNGTLEWVNMADVQEGDMVPIDRTESWPENTNDLDEETAYFLGLLVGDGGYTQRGSILFTSADQELIDAVSRNSMRLWGKPFNRVKSSKYGYLLCGTAIWDELIYGYGLKTPVCEHKDFPGKVLGASKVAAAAFIRGLMDTDGCVHKNGTIQISAKSNKIIRTLQFVLTRFGIISRVNPQYNKKYDRNYYYLTISGSNVRKYREHIGFGLKRKQELLIKACSRPCNTNNDIIPSQLVLNGLLNLSSEWRASQPVRSREWYKTNRSVARQDLTPWRLKRYGTTYDKLEQALNTTANLCDTQEWGEAERILNEHYFYDEVKSVTPGYGATYDVHVPEDHSFISNGFISHNSWLLALYAMLRLIFNQGSKVVIVGAAFRQAKCVFDYAQEMWESSPVLQDLAGNNRNNGPRRDIDKCTMRIGNSLLVALPMGDGQKIRGHRANIILCDEFASVGVDIFETVIRGFAAVSLSPIQQLQHEARVEAMRELGIIHEENEISSLRSNQTVISGTAYYSFNHFYSYWKRYKAIVESRGDQHKLEEIFNGKIPDKFSWKDYSVIRIPYNLLPSGFMDEKMISQARATIDKATFELEYGANFSLDSNGYFKRTLIEKCVVGKPQNPIEYPSCGVVHFSATLQGRQGYTYVMAIDPASERDNLSVVILELWPDHRRIVHCWTTNRARYKQQRQNDITKENEYYHYAARKIRQLHRLFPCERIGIDSQGGGVAILEALQNPDLCGPGERPLYEIIEEDNPKPTDGLNGEHIIEQIQFSNANWVQKANTGMRKDFEDRILLFPEFDSAVLGLAIEEDKETGRVVVDNKDASIERLFDGLEDCIMEIEELKDELAQIVHTQVGTTLRDRWDVPEVKLPGSKKGRLRKDRYSSLLMANMIARTSFLAIAKPEYSPSGGVVGAIPRQADGQPRSGPMYFGEGINTNYIDENMRDYMNSGNYGTVVRRGV